MRPDEIPGVAEAMAWEAAARARAFLDVPYTLGGVEVLPLSLHRLALLDTVRSPFLCGGAITPEAVAQFLWVLAPAFQAGDAEARALFIAGLRENGALDDLAGCVRQVGEFLDEMFLDAPAAGKGGGGSPAYTSQEAVYCEIFAEACGWTEQHTLHTPLPRLYQILRRVTLRKVPDATFINRRSDKVRGDWLRDQQTKIDPDRTP